MVMFLAFVNTRAPSGVVPPILPVTEMSPIVPALNVIAAPPSRVLSSVMFAPATAVLRLVVPETVTALVSKSVPPAVMELDKATLPVPFCVNVPPMFNAAPMVKRPELVTSIGPEPVVVVTAPFRLKTEPARDTPPTAFVVMAAKEDVPDPASCVTVLALMLPDAANVATELIVKAFNRTVAPRLLLKTMLPTPDAKVRD